MNNRKNYLSDNIKSFLQQSGLLALDQQNKLHNLLPLADELRRLAKMSILFVHKNQLEEVDSHLQKAKKIAQSLIKKAAKTSLLEDSDPLKGSMEEYLEAKILVSIIYNRKLNTDDITLNPERKLGAFSDVCGEIARYCVRNTSRENIEMVTNFRDVVEDIILLFNETPLGHQGYLRHKYSQAERSLRKIEDLIHSLKQT